jgi:hypothetical protein
MVDQSERVARLLVRALFYATDGEPRWWGLPTNLNDLTKEAIAVTVARGWMPDRGDSVRLTDAGRDLVAEGRSGAIGLPGQVYRSTAKPSEHYRLVKRGLLHHRESVSATRPPASATTMTATANRRSQNTISGRIVSPPLRDAGLACRRYHPEAGRKR